MKTAVSISIGSSKRDKVVEVELLGEEVRLERIGTDGDMQKAVQMYKDMDGRVDALGMGGALLGFLVGKRWYPMHSVTFLTEDVKHTPVLDGTGFKRIQERRAAELLNKELGDQIQPKRVLAPSAVDRYSLAQSFAEHGYECVFGDLMFALGIGIPIRSMEGLHRVAKILLPVASRLPFEWLYPVGESQELRTPKWVKYFEWATVIASDCHYITRYMPDDMRGKIIVTNTTTEADWELFRKSGVEYLMTTTPLLEGRSFGTNMMEAGLVAAMGWKDPIDYANAESYYQAMEKAIDEMGIQPKLQKL